MRSRPEVLESPRRIVRAPGDTALHQRADGRRVPPLPDGPGRGAEHERKRNQERARHVGAISRRTRVAATALVASLALGCEDALVPGDNTVPTADLVVLALASGAPAPAPVQVMVKNRTVVVRALRHTDPFNTLYLEIRFPAGCLSRLDGKQLTVDDSVLVTIDPLPDAYGFSLSPSGLEFALESTPSVTFSYGRYADASVADGVPKFPDRASYLGALDVWEEVSLGRWRVARGSGSAGLDAVAAAVDAPGQFRLAASR